MRRIFIEQEQIAGDTAAITGPEARHLGVVLRARPGDRIELLDGSGLIYLAEISSIKKSIVQAAIISRQEVSNNPPYLHLGLGLLKGKKMDFIIQKANELGVESIYPFSSENCVVPPPSASQYKRWQRIIRESCKQCGRARLLICNRHRSFADLINQGRQFDRRVILWENETTGSLRQLSTSPAPESSLLLIGPEGGFQPAEIDLAAGYDFNAATLGRQILRADTAALSAIAIAQFLLGDL